MLSRPLCAVAFGMASVVAIPVVYGAEKTPEKKVTEKEVTPAERKAAEVRIQEGLNHFEKARLELTAADPLYAGNRARAIEQTDYAIEQSMVALSDVPGHDQRRLEWDRTKKAAEEKAKSTPAGKDAAAAKKASDEHLREALKKLVAGQKILKETLGHEFGGHKGKAVYFAEEATRDVREGLGMPREGK